MKDDDRRLVEKLKGVSEPVEELGPTGQYPDGKLSEDDDGELRFALAHDPSKDIVVMSFGVPVNWLGVPAPIAEHISRGLVAHASRLRPKFHRDAPDIPTDPALRSHTARWLLDHPLWYFPVELPDGTVEKAGGGFYETVDIEIAYVDPKTESIRGEPGDTDPRNVAPRLWLEAGGWADRSQFAKEHAPQGGWTDYNKWTPIHDIRLDCGGADIESALLALAQRVAFFYNEDGSKRNGAPEQCRGDEETTYYKPACTQGHDGYCTTCGFLVRTDTEKSNAPALP